MTRAKQAKTVVQMTIAEWEKAFPDEDACCAYLVEHRWPNGAICPRCGSVNVYRLATMAWKWECPDCRQGGAYRFSLLTGTIFENTNKPLREWFRVIHMMLTSKKGVSSLQIQRVMGFGSYETALYMTHRIRAGLTDKEFKKLVGVVEVDETFVGGKAKNRYKDKRGDGKNGRGPKGKAIVAGAVQRKGNVVARVIANTKATTLRGFIDETVSTKVSLICTDDFKGYRSLGKKFPHGSVNHFKEQYVCGAIHTQTIEGFWSLVKRGMVGTFHKVSAKYLPLYVAEFEFRYNNRNNVDIFGTAMSAC